MAALEQITLKLYFSANWQRIWRMSERLCLDMKLNIYLEQQINMGHAKTQSSHLFVQTCCWIIENSRKAGFLFIFFCFHINLFGIHFNYTKY